jgi:hypothetical protein
VLIKINLNLAGRWCLTTVILPLQEAEIKRIMVQIQPRQMVHETVSQKITYYKKEPVDWFQV